MTTEEKSEQPRIQKVLTYLYEAEELARPKEIGKAIGESALNVGKDLHQLKERGLAEAEEEGQWKITPDGTASIIKAKPKAQPKPKPKPEPKPAVEEKRAIPTQADILRSIGESLGVGAKKAAGLSLDAIMYYVERTANLYDLTSVWNALSEMRVANDVKKTWLKLYSQTLPDKKISDELKEKLGTGLESEKVAKAEAGEIPPKPKRFMIVNDQIIGDPEGDLNFKEALQLLAQQKGAPVAQPDPLVAMVEAMKLGLDMATATLTAMIPLITKEPPKSDDNVLLQFVQTQQQNTQQQMQLLLPAHGRLPEAAHTKETGLQVREA